jgi:hypothetical protein
MKKNLMLVVAMEVVIGALLAISSATPAAADDARPTIVNCTCKVWSTYIKDCADWVDRSMIKDGVHPNEFFHAASKVMAEREREAYINGLISAYRAVYSITKKEMYNLPYCVGQYEVELEAYANDPKNADVPISAAILIVNNKIGVSKDSGRAKRADPIPRY